MNDITYGTVAESYVLGDTLRISYGIVAYAHAEYDGTATIIESVHDISDVKKQVDDLVALCNRNHLALEHLYDVIDDFLTI